MSPPGNFAASIGGMPEGVYARRSSCHCPRKQAMTTARQSRGNAMARLPELDPAKFSPEQKKVHEAILAGPRGKVVGPIKVWLNNPGLAEHAQALGAYCRFNRACRRGSRSWRSASPARSGRRTTSGSRTRRSPSRPASMPAAIEAIRTGAQADIHQERRAGDLRFRQRDGRRPSACRTRPSSAPRKSSARPA